MLPRDASDASDATRPFELPVPEPFLRPHLDKYPVVAHAPPHHVSSLPPHVRCSENVPTETSCIVVHAIPPLAKGGEECCSRQEAEALRTRGLDEDFIQPCWARRLMPSLSLEISIHYNSPCHNGYIYKYDYSLQVLSIAY